MPEPYTQLSRLGDFHYQVVGKELAPDLNLLGLGDSGASSLPTFKSLS